jgi:hypothetical protein
MTTGCDAAETADPSAGVRVAMVERLPPVSSASADVLRFVPALAVTVLATPLGEAGPTSTISLASYLKAET